MMMMMIPVREGVFFYDDNDDDDDDTGSGGCFFLLLFDFFSRCFFDLFDIPAFVMVIIIIIIIIKNEKHLFPTIRANVQDVDKAVSRETCTAQPQELHQTHDDD